MKEINKYKNVYGQTGGAGTTTIVTNNSFKKTNIYSGLSVYDYVNSGTTISGLITTQQTYNYNYSALPVYLFFNRSHIKSYKITS